MGMVRRPPRVAGQARPAEKLPCAGPQLVAQGRGEVESRARPGRRRGTVRKPGRDRSRTEEAATGRSTPRTAARKTQPTRGMSAPKYRIPPKFLSLLHERGRRVYHIAAEAGLGISTAQK